MNSEQVARAAVLKLMGPLVKLPKHLRAQTPLLDDDANLFAGLSQNKIKTLSGIFENPGVAFDAGKNIGLLISEANGPKTRITLNFVGFDQWERNVQETALAILKGLLIANQPTLIVSELSDNNEILAKFYVPTEQGGLIHVHRNAVASTNMVDVEREYGKNGIPLAQTVVTRNGTEEAFTKGTKYLPLFFETIANTINKEIQALLVALRAA
ncbi:MAG: hypothetical protein IPN90_06920 [Elusimicrobia bacterium]|nr:hypothetical protein [Elusimicrobiota bacterium]